MTIRPDQRNNAAGEYEAAVETLRRDDTYRTGGAVDYYRRDGQKTKNRVDVRLWPDLMSVISHPSRWAIDTDAKGRRTSVGRRRFLALCREIIETCPVSGESCLPEVQWSLEEAWVLDLTGRGGVIRTRGPCLPNALQARNSVLLQEQRGTPRMAVSD